MNKQRLQLRSFFKKYIQLQFFKTMYFIIKKTFESNPQIPASPNFHAWPWLSQPLAARPLCAAIRARGCEEDLSQSSLPLLLVATSARTTSHLSGAEIYVAVQKEANPARQS